MHSESHLRKIRVNRNLSMEALAFEVEMELSQVYRIEKEKINPTLSTLASLAKGLEIGLSNY